MIAADRHLTGATRGTTRMTDPRRTGRIGALLISALVLAACGGATATAPAGGETTTPAGATTAPSAAASEAAPSLGALPSIGAIPSFDLSALSGAIPGVDSYQTSMSMDGEEQYHSVVVTQPVLSKAITTFDGGEPTQRIIVIGEEAWIADGADGGFEPVPEQLASSMLIAFDPALMLGGFASVDWGTAGAQLGTENKNGVQAHHLRIDSTTTVGLAGQIPAGAAIDVWVAEAGHLVAWEMSGFPQEANISINVTNVNDPANQVERPD
jgi:hypothetical protein